MRKKMSAHTEFSIIPKVYEGWRLLCAHYQQKTLGSNVDFTLSKIAAPEESDAFWLCVHLHLSALENQRRGCRCELNLDYGSRFKFVSRNGWAKEPEHLFGRLAVNCSIYPFHPFFILLALLAHKNISPLFHTFPIFHPQHIFNVPKSLLPLCFHYSSQKFCISEAEGLQNNFVSNEIYVELSQRFV